LSEEKVCIDISDGAADEVLPKPNALSLVPNIDKNIIAATAAD